MAEIDPVKFGELCANVENTHTKLCEFIDTVKDHVKKADEKETVQDEKIGQLEKDIAVKKGAVLAVLGTGTLAGLTLPDGVKKILEAIGKAFS